uniref:Uncharacterized protein n=1 Tax=Coccidioides posadasii RMSCC 3488 TaxID=454284 RepID=A0A0J6F5S8_COCPO|nr:hypothetical protein CPAG_00977 [Coccidioides posadasii RMSCC 3488]
MKWVLSIFKGGGKLLVERPLPVLTISILCILGLENASQYINSVWAPKGKITEDSASSLNTKPRTVRKKGPKASIKSWFKKSDDDSSSQSSFWSDSGVSSPFMYSVLSDISHPERLINSSSPETERSGARIGSSTNGEPGMPMRAPFTPPHQIIDMDEYLNRLPRQSPKRRYSGSGWPTALPAALFRTERFLCDSDGHRLKWDASAERIRRAETVPPHKRLNHLCFVDRRTGEWFYMPFEPVPFGFTRQPLPDTPSVESVGCDSDFEKMLKYSPSTCKDRRGDNLGFEDDVYYRAWNLQTEGRIEFNTLNLSEATIKETSGKDGLISFKPESGVGPAVDAEPETDIVPQTDELSGIDPENLGEVRKPASRTQIYGCYP